MFNKHTQSLIKAIVDFFNRKDEPLGFYTQDVKDVNQVLDIVICVYCELRGLKIVYDKDWYALKIIKKEK